MNKIENDVFLSLSEKKINISVFSDSDNKIVFFNKENININPITENTNFEILEKLLEKNIKQIEKKINSFVNNISLMIDTASSLSVNISLMKKLDNKKIQKKDIKHLIQDAKQQIIMAYPEQSIVHIIVKKYVVNDLDYKFAPIDIACNKISLEIKFICFPKNLIKKIEILFNNFQITVNKIICTGYAKSFINHTDEENICQIGHKLKNGFNKQEVVIIPKKIEKKGFFEKLFHFFK
tara:strand:+ start:438 stop:1148 length:711 start_codon:yes stop_codon:yes gene_type:complete